MTNWNRSIKGIADVRRKHTDDDMPFEEMRDKVVTIFKKDPAYLGDHLERDGDEDDTRFTEAVWELAEANTDDEYDDAMTDIYDWADDVRVWINPTRQRSAT